MFNIKQLGYLLIILMMTPLSWADDDEKALRHLKAVLWPKAYAEQDSKLLDSILAKEFQMIDAKGNWYTKADELDYIKNNKTTYDSFAYKIIRLDTFENGTAVVSGRGPYIQSYQSSNILIKRNGDWKAISSHVSGIKRKQIKK